MADIAASGQLADKTRALLGELWEKNLHIVKARLDLLENAAATTPLPETLRVEAMNIAHKLAGSLGMFGFTEGTRISRQLELALDIPAPDHSQLTLLTHQLRAELFSASIPAATSS
jgi:HPt (histidine-containing phosphotransfer) domain-containing protein